MAICYRDRAFCTAYPHSCANDACPRAMTPATMASAVAWWGDTDVPVCYAHLGDDCDDRIPVTEETDDE